MKETEEIFAYYLQSVKKSILHIQVIPPTGYLATVGPTPHANASLLLCTKLSRLSAIPSQALVALGLHMCVYPTRHSPGLEQ